MTVLAQELTEELALRIGLACQELSLSAPQVLIARLKELFDGQLPDRERMKTVTPCQLRPLLQPDLPELTGKKLKSALHWLASWEPEKQSWTGEARCEAIADQAPFGVIRVALASTDPGGECGHFASCSHFAIHDVTPGEIRSVANRGLSMAEPGLDKVEARLSLIRDCRILVVGSIGGPAAARVTRSGALPLKLTEGQSAAEWLERLRQVLSSGAPPPWLRRIMAGESAGPEVVAEG